MHHFPDKTCETTLDPTFKLPYDEFIGFKLEININARVCGLEPLMPLNPSTAQCQSTPPPKYMSDCSYLNAVANFYFKDGVYI